MSAETDKIISDLEDSLNKIDQKYSLTPEKIVAKFLDDYLLFPLICWLIYDRIFRVPFNGPEMSFMMFVWAKLFVRCVL